MSTLFFKEIFLLCLFYCPTITLKIKSLNRGKKVIATKIAIMMPMGWLKKLMIPEYLLVLMSAKAMTNFEPSSGGKGKRLNKPSQTLTCTTKNKKGFKKN